ncbi:DUF7695 domain-containing protein [Paenibacillus macquariensis]|uniref:DUF7695 domain-containing protein n=1 Tax=Paenibacillus macquariensis TaxID=948756 RepID=A0ABY1JWD1_9BACL|nr:hypothetical protein PMSM_11745 [Paenibacillus macquariensis subsp. macquariensis]SIQ83715.1 hypothetical protein SAMN05421578_104278 [Paenibacillus macquariensis]
MVKIQIKRNKIRCKRCLDIVESTFVYECKFCSCGAIGVDGGREYLRRIGAFDDIKELSEWTSEPIN